MPLHSPFQSLAEPANDSTAGINKNKQDHSANRDRNEEPIKQIHPIDQRISVSCWGKMADPAIRKVYGSIRVASAAGIQQVFFNNGRIRICYLLDVMNPVAVGAYGCVYPLIWMLFSK